MQCYRQFLRFSLKDIVECVLRQFGLEAPQYSNEPTKNGEFTGEVIVQLPQIECVRCGGRTMFCGRLRLSADEAEEDAAYKVIRYMESRLKVVIVDMNYLDRTAGASLAIFGSKKTTLTE
jgi:hypothetical protein